MLKKLKILSQVLVLINIMFCMAIFGVAIIISTNNKYSEIIINPGLIIFNDLLIIMKNIAGSNSQIIEIMKKNQEKVGIILIIISFMISIIYFIIVFMKKNNKFKIIGQYSALFIEIITIILTIMTIIIASEQVGKNSFSFGISFSPLELLFLVGPVFILIDTIIRLIYYQRFKNQNTLNTNEQNKFNIINIKKKRIKKSTVQKKEKVSLNENKSLSEMVSVTKLNNNTNYDTKELKLKIVELKNKIAKNTKIKTSLDKISANNKEVKIKLEYNSWNTNNQINKNQEKINVYPKGQYLKIKKEQVQIIDESPKEIAINKKENFIQKNDIIKNNNPYKYNNKNYDILFSKTKSNHKINTTYFKEKNIEFKNKNTPKVRSNPNAIIDNSYNGKLFLGDSDKIWLANKKYRAYIKTMQTSKTLDKPQIIKDLSSQTLNEDKKNFTIK